MKSLSQNVARQLIRAASWNWMPHSRLILYGDDAGWSLHWDMLELGRICRKMGIRIARPVWKHAASPQSIFFASQFFITERDWQQRFLPNKIGFSYFHGLPDHSDELMDKVYNALCENHEKISRIQVSHTQMRDVTLETGIDPSKVFLIPIGINLEYFPARTNEHKKRTRNKLGIPQTAFVVGSFQKDGNGWDEGTEPKLIKGPDIFLSTIRLLKKNIPELYVLLTGPARGYVKRGLEGMGVPYKHAFYKYYPEVADMFSAIDLYIVSSRQEGGPKAILESMASGVPLVTTRVGQAMDLVNHGNNAFMAEVEDVEALASHVLKIYNSSAESLKPILNAARKTAEANTYDSLLPLWAEFMKGFVTPG